MSQALSHMSAVDILVSGVIACLAVFVLGAIANAVLRDTGFGTIVNGILLVVGVAMGAFARAVTFGF